ncbi:MAG: AtpZ/AtpI family protein [Actinomycetota bacterium]|nr:AtpZ/AtpI family protein [Actinomycetota bacterium]
MRPSERPDRTAAYRDVDKGTAMLAEFVAAPLTWGAIGWLADTYAFHTSPWGVIVGGVLGFVLGNYLLYLRMVADGGAADDERVRRAREAFD